VGQAYLQVPGIDGDSTDFRHVGWIEIASFASDERDGMRRFTITKGTDRASTPLSIAWSRSTQFDTVTIDDMSGAAAMRYVIDKVMIASVSKEGTETVIFNGTSSSVERLQYCFLSVSGVAGESTAPGHQGWIDAVEFRVAEDELSASRFSVDSSPAKPPLLPIVHVRIIDGKYIPALAEAFQSKKHSALVQVEEASDGATRYILNDAWITRFEADAKRRHWVTFESKQNIKTELAPSKPAKPASHPVVRSNSSAATERSTINLRVPKFYELALPVLTSATGARIHPPLNGELHLTSNKGYREVRPIAAGMITDDQYCSFRFYDITEKQIDDLFTAELQTKSGVETIFKDRRIATYIQAARTNSEFEATFAPGPQASQASDAHDELLPPAAGSDGAA